MRSDHEKRLPFMMMRAPVSRLNQVTAGQLDMCQDTRDKRHEHSIPFWRKVELDRTINGLQHSDLIPCA